MPTTLRIALLAGLLALLSNLAVIGFIYCRTHDEAAVDGPPAGDRAGQGAGRRLPLGGKPALDDADPTTRWPTPTRRPPLRCSAPTGAQVEGNLEAVPPSALPPREGYRNALIRLRGQTTPREAA